MYRATSKAGERAIFTRRACRLNNSIPNRERYPPSDSERKSMKIRTLVVMFMYLRIV